MMGVPPQRFGRSSTLKWGGSVFPKRPATPLRALPQPSPEQLQQMKAAYEQAMKDPEEFSACPLIPLAASKAA